MPNVVEYVDSYNEKLYEVLLKLFASWKYVPQPANLARMIAHQSSLETQIRQKKIHRGLNVTERTTTTKRYLASLYKARKLWGEMENDDQISLSRCLKELTDGHEIMDVLEIDQIYRGFKPHDGIAEWRKPALNKHRSWGIDMEMLDVLIGAAEHWLNTKSPISHEKIDPTLYAVIYMCGNCENHNIKASSAANSHFTEIVSTYFKYTDFLESHKSADEMKMYQENFKDIIEKANLVWKRDYPNVFIQYEEPAYPEQLELFGYR
ncbi:hypothetical protein QN391_25325 [Pseudomonas sp. CCI1.2]|uniref:hypothetical protein n=1 Tax=Pseudomonas sp. CCI1.2 TaxID=3048614 RepID=UPI002B222A90|nr:hypothetical protein [Pseudomonas sp. CCI1.2]MEB0123975.1 hypothetical protein [Pseudomonas sp. CCI1.2]